MILILLVALVLLVLLLLLVDDSSLSGELLTGEPALEASLVVGVRVGWRGSRHRREELNSYPKVRKCKRL